MQTNQAFAQQVTYADYKYYNLKNNDSGHVSKPYHAIYKSP